MRSSTFLTSVGLISFAVGFVMPVYGQTTDMPRVTTTTTKTTSVNGVPIASSTTSTTMSTDWPVQNGYWQQTFTTRPYYRTGTNYRIYEPAYQYGVGEYLQYHGRAFNEVREAIREDWNNYRNYNSLTWEQAQPVIEDAYDRLYDAHAPLPSDTTSTTAGASGLHSFSPVGAAGSTGSALGR